MTVIDCRGCGASEAERHHCAHQPRAVGGHHTRWQMCQSAVLQIGVALHDDRLRSMNLVSCNGVRAAGGEEHVDPVGIEQGRMVEIPPVQLRDPVDHEPATNVVGFLHRRVHPNRDGHVEPSGQCSGHRSVTAVRRVRAEPPPILSAASR